MPRLRSDSAAAWLAPTLAFISVAGPCGGVGKLALDDIAWQELLLWTTIAYMIISAVILIGWRRGVTIEPATKWGMVAGVNIVGTIKTVSQAHERECPRRPVRCEGQELGWHFDNEEEFAGTTVDTVMP